MQPRDSHDEFQELCAASTAGSLSPEESRRLAAHLAHCESCRSILAQYQAIVDEVIPALGYDRTEDDSDSSDWSVEEAEKELFARLREAEKEPDPRSRLHVIPKGARELPAVESIPDDALWRHMWVQFAAALVLIAALGVTAYRVGIGRGADRTGSAPVPASPKPSNPVSTEAISVPAAAPEDPQAKRRVLTLEGELEKKITELDQLKTQMAGNLHAADGDRLKAANQQAEMSKDLDLAREKIQSLEHELDTAAARNSQDSLRIADLERKASQLTDSLRDRDQEVARERDLLDHDRDIRELMGSRDLYIAEVYDVAKTGDTKKPFGRVFYTRGKSLIFYAYDLDQQPGIRNAATFQAWGRRGPDRDRAVNLGIFYQDNANKKRWVVKSDNPRSLAEIDAVFVTVEPDGGSPHPSGQPLLFAYLRVEPNHP